jgi:hypothetical protein
MTNRIVDCIARYDERIAKQGKTGMDGRPVQDLHKGMSITFREFTTFQNAQSQAFAAGKITADEALTVYAALGGEVYRGDWPAGTSLATKLTITQFMGELMGI